ncbi:MAG TPA: hypothetical protein VFQ63_02755 [Patescibacteria group bacterium]|nr:hypothetical protein [Patescibacteria group bacterium]
MSVDSRIGLAQIMVPQAIDVAEQQLAQRLLHDYPHVRIMPSHTEGLGSLEHAYYTAIDATNTINAVAYQFADKTFFESHPQLQDAKHLTPILTLLEGVSILETVIRLQKGQITQESVKEVADYIKRDILTVNRYGGLEAYTNPLFAAVLSGDAPSQASSGETHLAQEYILGMLKMVRGLQENNYLENGDEATKAEFIQLMQGYVQGSILARSSVTRAYFNELLPVRWDKLRRKAKRVTSPFSENSPELFVLLADLRNIAHDCRTPITTLKATQQILSRRLGKVISGSQEAELLEQEAMVRMHRQWVRLYNTTLDRTDDFLQGRNSETEPVDQLVENVFRMMRVEVSSLFGDSAPVEVFTDETEGTVSGVLHTVSMKGALLYQRLPQNILTNIWKVARSKNFADKLYIGVGGHIEEVLDGRRMLVLTFRDNLGGYPSDIVENGWGYHGYGRDADGEAIASTGDGLKGIYEEVTTFLQGDFIPTNFGPEEICVGDAIVQMTGACTRLYLPIR